MSDTTVEEIIHHILSVLDSVDLPRRTWVNSAARLVGLDKDALSALYNSIPQDEISVSLEKREKRGRIRITSDKGYEYIFTARYVLNRKRTFATEKIDVDRKIPNGEFIAQVDLYRNGIGAAPVTGDAETIAKRIISRLSETETEEVKWILGGSLEAEAAALFEKIPKQNCDHEKHTSYEKGYLTILGDDGLEYILTANFSSDCGGSEWYDEESLFIECPAASLRKRIYYHGEYYR